ncbi:MAG: ABC transporter substrate-binding protein [Deltaproteobacteria bacterium]|nr:ABC transporter substrate-binding protein [Deltaproteobacteria bacterium]
MVSFTSDSKWDLFLKKMSRRDFVIKSIAAGGLLMVPRFVRAGAAEPYRIGVALPTTGPGANYSERPIKGLPLIAAQINQRGGLLGKHPIELYFRDTQTKPDVGAREARSLILNDKVKTIIGTWSSAVAMAIQEVIHERKVLHLAATSNSSKIVNENFTPYTFQFGPNSRMQSGATVVAVLRMIKTNGWKRYVTIGQDYEWGRDAQSVFVKKLSKDSPSTELIKELWCKLGETDFTSYITAIMALKPDFLFGAIAGKDNETFVQQAKASGLFKRIAYPGVFLPVTELMQQRKTLPRNIIGLNRCPFFAHMDNPMMQNYVKTYQAKFGPDDYPDDFACMYFDALNGLDQAVRKARSTNSDAVKDALKGAAVDTCRGKLTFRECNNQLDANSYVGKVVDTPDYPFPIFDLKTMVIVKGHEVWLPTCEEVKKLQKNRA